MDPVARLRALLERTGLIEVPGCYDAFSARLIERAGFPAAYMTGFGVSASTLGLPDVGLVCFKEMADRAAAIADAVRIPLIADADTGYGGAANVYRTVKAYARAGVAAIQLEDQAWPKRCGHTEGKEVVPLEEAVGKLRAAADARSEKDILIVARTDARSVLGFQAAIDRCLAFSEAGADVIFFEAPESREEMVRIAKTVKVPLLANMVEGGRTPLLTREELETLGYKIAIYPVTLLLAATHAMLEHLEPKIEGGGFPPWKGPLSFEKLKALVGFPEHAKFEQKYR